MAWPPAGRLLHSRIEALTRILHQDVVLRQLPVEVGHQAFGPYRSCRRCGKGCVLLAMTVPCVGDQGFESWSAAGPPGEIAGEQVTCEGSERLAGITDKAHGLVVAADFLGIDVD